MIAGLAQVEPEQETMEFTTESARETMDLGRLLGEMLDRGMVLGLVGDLGSGKTVLAKGLARGLGVADEGEVTSPSFTLVNEYRGRFPVHHLDLYRLQNPGEAEDLGWEEFISEGAVTIVEWAEKIPRLLPEERIEIHLRWLSFQKRRLTFIGLGPSAKRLVSALGHKWGKEE